MSAPGAGRSISRCPWCGTVQTKATGLDPRSNAAPVADDVSICVACARPALFTGAGLEIRRPSPDELADIMANPDVLAAVRMFQRARAEGRT